MNSHTPWEERITARLDGVISPEEDAALEAHLASCPDCAALLDTLREVRSLLEEDAPVPETLTPAVMAAIRAEKPAKKRSKVIWLRWAGLAAAVALVSFAGLSLLNRDKSADATNIATEGVLYSLAPMDTPAETEENFFEQSLMMAPAVSDAAPEPAPKAAPELARTTETAAAELTKPAAAEPEAEPEAPAPEATQYSTAPVLLLTYAPEEADLEALLVKYDLETVYAYENFNIQAVAPRAPLDAEALQALTESLAHEPGILSVEPDSAVSLS